MEQNVCTVIGQITDVLAFHLYLFGDHYFSTGSLFRSFSDKLIQFPEAACVKKKKRKNLKFGLSMCELTSQV